MRRDLRVKAGMRHSEQEVQPRQRKKQFGRSHEDLVDPAAIVAGNNPDHTADQKGNESRYNSRSD